MNEPSIYHTAYLKTYFDSIGLNEEQNLAIRIYVQKITRFCLIIGLVAGILIRGMVK